MLTYKQAVDLFRHNYLTLRQQRGFTQADIWRRTGIAQSQLSALECGKTAPSLNTLCRLGKALGCGPGDFLTER